MLRLSEEEAAKFVAGALFLTSIALLLFYTIPLILYPSEGLYHSGFFHKCGTLWFEGGVPYRDFACPQPPLATLIMGAFQFLWKSVATTRILGLLVFLGILYASKRVIELEVERRVPIGYLFLFLIAPFLYKISISTILIDAVCLLLGIVGVYFYRKGERKSEGKTWELGKNFNTVLSGVFFFLSTMAKYFGPAFVVAILVYGLAKKRWRQTGVFAASYFPLLAASVAFMQLITNGYFLRDTIFHVYKPYQEWGGAMFTQYLVVDLFPIAYLVLFYFIKGDWKATLEGHASFYGLLFVAVGGEALYLVYKSGGNLNYALYVELVLLILLYIEAFNVNPQRKILRNFLAAVIFVQFLVYANASYNDTRAFLEAAPLHLKASSFLEEAARLTDKPVVAEFSSITFWNARFPERGRFSDAYMFHDLKRLGLWDDQELVNQIVENDVQLLIFAKRFEVFNKFHDFIRREYNGTIMCYLGVDYGDIGVFVYTNNATLWKEIRRLREEQLPYCKAIRPEYNPLISLEPPLD